MSYNRWRIFERDGFRCVYCGAHASEAKLHIDHRHPRRWGGTDHELNLVAACAPCNLSKRDKIPKWEPCTVVMDGDTPSDFRLWLMNPRGYANYAWNNWCIQLRDLDVNAGPEPEDGSPDAHAYWARYGWWDGLDEIDSALGFAGTGNERCARSAPANGRCSPVWWEEGQTGLPFFVARAELMLDNVLREPSADCLSTPLPAEVEATA